MVTAAAVIFATVLTAVGGGTAADTAGVGTTRVTMILFTADATLFEVTEGGVTHRFRDKLQEDTLPVG